MILKKFNVERVENDPLKIRELKANGFIELEAPIVDDPQDEPVVEKPDYSTMLKTELVTIANSKGIAGAKNMLKADLINALEEAE